MSVTPITRHEPSVTQGARPRRNANAGRRLHLSGLVLSATVALYAASPVQADDDTPWLDWPCPAADDDGIVVVGTGTL